MSGEIDLARSSQCIKPGLKVLIRRNDGRTHYAIIANVNRITRFVAVEWFEDDETKGKEVDFDTLISMNNHLEPAKSTSNQDKYNQDGISAQIVPKSTEALPISQKRPSSTIPSRSRSSLEKTFDDVKGNKNENAGDQPGCDVRDFFGNFKRTLPKSKKSSMSLDDIPSRTKDGFDQRDSKGLQYKRKRDLSTSSARSPDNAPLHQSFVETPSKQSSSPGKNLQFNTLVRGKPKRKSSTVKEVEKLERNRELRRLKQAAQKEVRETMQTINSGNPNWQFQAMIHDFQGRMEFQPLTGDDEVTDDHQITVCVRKRPLNKREQNNKEVDVISIPRKNLIVVHEPKNKVDLTKYLDNQQFRFDYAFDEMCSNETVYNFTARPLVETIFDGGAATCFAYGQTGSGKTHTMSGANNGSEKGIYAMVAVDVFQKLRCPSHASKNLFVSCSYYEIYGGKVYDLLAKKARLRVLEDGKQQVQIVGLTEKMVGSVSEVLTIIQCGNNARTSGKTSANSSSSRSHAIFRISLRQVSGKTQSLYGRIHLIDLAGNERGADTSSSSRITRLEGAEINKSLLALKECIRALGRKCANAGSLGSATGAQGSHHLPFRGSTLTLVLRDSFIGDKTKTCMIATISPGMASCEHSLNTLRYADRVKELAAAPDALPTQTVAQVQNEGYCLDEINEDEETNGSKMLDVNDSKGSGSPILSMKTIRILQLEQDVIDTLRIWTQRNRQLSQQENQLLADSCNGRAPLDPWRFCDDLQTVLTDRQKLLTTLSNRVAAYRCQLDSEEARGSLISHASKDQPKRR